MFRNYVTITVSCKNLILEVAVQSTACDILLTKLMKQQAVPLQAWSDPEGSRKLRFPDFMTTA